MQKIWNINKPISPGGVASVMFLEELEMLAGAGRVSRQEPMALHTTFQIGGPADYYVTPQKAGEAAGIVRLCQREQMPLTVIGNGSNLLVSDKGVRGVVMALEGSLAFRENRALLPKRASWSFYDFFIKGTQVWAGAGIPLSALAVRTAAAGLSGLEYAGGIPGTLGGGIMMNAGAYGGELADCLKEVLLIRPDGELVLVAAADLKLGYRTSRMQQTGEIVAGAHLQLSEGDAEQALARIREFNARRREKQPLEYPSAGSAFKRPEGYFAGKLIQEAGLSGFRIGDAQISEKHCGFLINRGAATATQVRELIQEVQARVWNQAGVRLEPEIRLLGDW